VREIRWLVPAACALLLPQHALPCKGLLESLLWAAWPEAYLSALHAFASCTGPLHDSSYGHATAWMCHSNTTDMHFCVR
jgi:hypothetical protein